jgi:hypothetical protein
MTSPENDMVEALDLHEALELREALEPILRDAADRRFQPGFTDRVMERIRAESKVPAILLTTALRGQFLRLAPLAAAVLVALGAYNLLGAGTSAGQSLLEAAVGLEPMTLETAYAFEQTYYPTNGE